MILNSGVDIRGFPYRLLAECKKWHFSRNEASVPCLNVILTSLISEQRSKHAMRCNYLLWESCFRRRECVKCRWAFWRSNRCTACCPCIRCFSSWFSLARIPPVRVWICVCWNRTAASRLRSWCTIVRIRSTRSSNYQIKQYSGWVRK